MNPPTTSNAVRSWMRSRERLWADWLSALKARPRDLNIVQAQRYVEQYRALAGDLATARRLLPRSSTTAALESLYGAMHASIDRSSRQTPAAVRALLRNRIPAAVSALAPTILWIALLFAVSTAAGLWLIGQYPELIDLVASSAMIEKVEHGQLWTEGMFNIAPSSILSVQILSNNIVVSIFAFVTSVFFGLGAFYIIAVNGLMLGALFAFTHQHGLDGELLKFVLAHGPVELSVMCIAAAAGTALGESLIRPDAPTRRESFQRAAERVGPVLIGCALLLIVCGFIEGYISPNPNISLTTRALIGLGYWGLMVLWLSGRLHAPPAANI
jgi:uncharacterized membrane protein SpoIIM required for sporulation